MPSSKQITAIAMTAVLLISGIGAFISDAQADATTTGVDAEINGVDDVRLQIYGNADGDDDIDTDDIDTINTIVSEKITDWETKYPFADADQDGTITSADADVVQDIIDKKEVKMYYLNFKGGVSYVNYPISHNIMCDYSTFELLCATHTMDDLMAIDQSATIYIGKYDKLSDCIVIPTNGNSAEHTLESLAAAMSQGVGTLIQWTGGGATNYLWEMENIDEIASELSIVSLTIQGPNCINGALMFAQMLGDITLADDYKEWYDEAVGLFDAIGTTIEKKTISCIRCFESDVYGTYRMYGSEQSPALWFNKVVDFQESYVGKTGFTVLNSLEELVSTATDEIILMTQRRDGTTYEEFDAFCEERLQTLYGNTEQYANGTIYMIEWEAMPFFSGPAGCYILAAYLYPEYFDLEDAYAFLQTYLDLFSPNEDADAHVGFTYKAVGTSADDGDDGTEAIDDGDGNVILYIAIAIVAIIAVAGIACYCHNRRNKSS